MSLKEKYLKTTRTVKGRAVDFKIDEVFLPNKKKAAREYLDHPGAVAVIPFLTPQKIILVKQFRYAVGKITTEIPAGKLDRGENPLSCIKRELAEETGYRAKSYKKLGAYWPTPAFSNEIIYIYTAHGLTPGKINLDDDEFLSTEVWALKDVFSAIKKGHIQDSKTIVALLMYAQFRK